MFDDGHACEGHDRLNEAFATPRNDEVEPTVHLGENGHAVPIGEWDELNRMIGQSCGGTTRLEDCGNRAVRVDRLAAAAQNGGIARLETQNVGIRGAVPAVFVNDADGADGQPDLLDAQAVGPLRLVDDFAHGIGQGGH